MSDVVGDSRFERLTSRSRTPAQRLLPPEVYVLASEERVCGAGVARYLPRTEIAVGMDRFEPRVTLLFAFRYYSYTAQRAV